MNRTQVFDGNPDSYEQHIVGMAAMSMSEDVSGDLCRTPMTPLYAVKSLCWLRVLKNLYAPYILRTDWRALYGRFLFLSSLIAASIMQVPWLIVQSQP